MTLTDSENAAVCMEVLVNAVGIVDAERFIAYMNRESGDYTVERRTMFDDMTEDDLKKGISDFEQSNPQLFKAFENRAKE